MSDVIFTNQDQHQIAAHGTTEKAILDQIDIFQRGFPFAQLDRPCTPGDGVTVLSPQDAELLESRYAEAVAAGRVQKFVPASGAASRMFKSLLAVHERAGDIDWSQLKTAPQDQNERDFLQFAEGMERFAFYQALREQLSQQPLCLDAALEQGQYKAILDALLMPSGLNYASLPKALLHFHCYGDHCRTPLEEHLMEASTLVQDRGGAARLHFTVSPEHGELMMAHLEQARQRYEQTGAHFEVSWSTQKLSTDTIAVDLDNQPFRDREGKLLFRPAGHGALLENLNDLQGDIFLIKNIDNIVPDHLKAPTYTYTRLLGGYLVTLQQQSFMYLEQLASGDVNPSALKAIRQFAEQAFSLSLPATFEQQSHQEQAELLFRSLHRPLRVCGVVLNTGEPGGGPFWVGHADGTTSLQIVETSQVDTNTETQRAILQKSTHFNPVNLVCGVRDFRGQPFDLMRFTDPETGFISQKSHEGKPLKALELPGLWNGAMAKWNTVFVEVPITTFNPVKTVLDLLRQEHQPAPSARLDDC
ncbi:MAG: hypothetical protein ETSY1_35970 [Candidatus Entotheonella factor]|uniref:DUF4301 domain-containing protein n=1 Tax=Entotheonella factor TaxID=1429438 RepID=W4L901_ENTF1|nr:DUF4301 family protein [Candidatus Entotheonella palauensis]ETW94185.1 MAG: hypothetical protein ETSY1_35970 [Candidatus Entotheonella factor]